MPRLLIYLWTLPTTFVGLLFLPFSIVGGGGIQLVEGVIEIHGGFAGFFLRHLVPLPGGASAMALGHVVIARNRETLDKCRTHERVHVRQAERWGPLFIPAYLAAGLMVKLRGKDAYYDNPFEREAYSQRANSPATHRSL
jgi:hypothetical protein